MLFYIVLAVASVIAAIVFLWLFRRVYDASHGVTDAMVPGVRRARKRRANRLAHLNPAFDRRSASENVPWGWPGNRNQDDDSLVNWPRRHSSSRWAASSNSRPEPRRKKAGKPWGW